MNYVDLWGLFSKKMQDAINDNLEQSYEKGVNDCDIWAEKVEKQAHPDSTLKEDWGDATKNTAQNHKENLDINLEKTMKLGTSIVIQETSKGPVHIMVACLNEDGSVDVAHMTNNPEGGKPENTPGYSEQFSYSSQEDFLNDGWGTLYFYNLGDGDDYKKNK